MGCHSQALPKGHLSSAGERSYLIKIWFCTSQISTNPLKEAKQMWASEERAKEKHVGPVEAIWALIWGVGARSQRVRARAIPPVIRLCSSGNSLQVSTRFRGSWGKNTRSQSTLQCWGEGPFPKPAREPPSPASPAGPEARGPRRAAHPRPTP